ncbi:hypothetical protein VTO73DRAFT_6236 [Trametes versicolor]
MPGRVEVVLTLPLLTPYFPKYSEGVDDSLYALLSGEVSAVLGGSTPYLQADEEWPCCKTCEHALIPYLQISLSSEKTPQEFRQHVPPLVPEGATLLQVFLCVEETAAGFCFEAWLTMQVEGESWLVRQVHVHADATGVGTASAAHDEAHGRLEEKGQLIPERVISEWTAGNPETVHWEACTGADFDEAFYEAHAPVDGLKLLGYEVLGKYYYDMGDDGRDQCTVGDGGPHSNWRCLIQLGTRDEDNPIYAIGNLFINQCERHPEIFKAVYSGTW